MAKSSKLNWRTHYRNLDPLEVRLFENGMFKLGDEGNVTTNAAWNEMMEVLEVLNTEVKLGDKITKSMITKKQINNYLDNPSKYIKLYSEKKRKNKIKEDRFLKSKGLRK